MAYTFDVYRGRLKAERHFGDIRHFTSPFFRSWSLVRSSALPICCRNSGWRIRSAYDYDRIVSRFTAGSLWGVFKKLVIADRLAVYVNAVYGDLERIYRVELWSFATLFYTFQIYCDFSAYSDIAIGLARVLGFRLMENFPPPQSVAIAQCETSGIAGIFRCQLGFVIMFTSALGGNRKGFKTAGLSICS